MEETVDVVAAESGAGAAGMGQVIGINEVFASQNPLAELRKALSAGYITDTGAMVDGGSLRIQSLEPTLKNLTFNEMSTTLANDLLSSKKKAESTVEEYSTIDGISEAFTYQEGGLPSQEDDMYSRKFELVKYIGAVGMVTNVITSVRTLVGAREAEIKRKTLAIKKKLNIVGYYGNAALVATEFNGLATAVQNANLSDNVIDLKGNAPTLENFNSAVNVIENIAGYAANLRLYISPNARNYYKAQLLKDKRYLVGGDHSAEVEGIKANKVVYDGGEFPMRKDMFLNPVKCPRRDRTNSTFIATGSTPPAVPTITAGAGSTEVVANAASTLPAATYDYAVVAVNQYGQKSTPATANGSGMVVASAHAVNIKCADGGSISGQQATCFELYRRVNGGADTDFRYMATFAPSAGVAYSDAGQDIPDTSDMFLIEWDTEQVLAYHQLLDMALFPLANVVDAQRWLQRLYGTLIVYNPKKVIHFKNVGSNLS